MPDDSERREEVQLEYHIAHYSGPLPPPEMMRGYEDVLPGSAASLYSCYSFEI